VDAAPAAIGDRARPAPLRLTIRAAARFATRPTRRNLLHWVSWALALVVELALVALLGDGHIYGWELALTRHLQAVSGRYPIFLITSTLTNTLSLPFLAIFAVILSLVLRSGHRAAALLLVLSFPLHVLAQFPKALIDRPRPSVAFDGIAGVGGVQSFPSGHAEYVVTFYGFLTYLALQHITSRWVRGVALLGWAVFALATGFGRVALGRHWPLDVLASYVIGLGLLSGLIWLHTAIRGTQHPATCSSAAPTLGKEDDTSHGLPDGIRCRTPAPRSAPSLDP
jgi:undecaprenyl-diphosphatase